MVSYLCSKAKLQIAYFAPCAVLVVTRPFSRRLFLAIVRKHGVILCNPRVHDRSRCRQKRATEPRPYVTCVTYTRNLVETKRVISEIFSLTDRHGHHNTPRFPIGGGVNGVNVPSGRVIWTSSNTARSLVTCVSAPPPNLLTVGLSVFAGLAEKTLIFPTLRHSK